jgi:FAD/FMN-containing dehydrogenase
LNIVAREFKEEIRETIEPYVYELVGKSSVLTDMRHSYQSDIIAENSGSISAEHGLGLMKAPYIRYSRDETAIDLMKKVKNLFDPKGLLNPGKYII